MSNKKIIVESLSMDLKRVALGTYRGSHQTAERFKQEALKRLAELEQLELENYLAKLVKNTKQVLASNKERSAEDTLMYSTLFQNFVLKKI